MVDKVTIKILRALHKRLRQMIGSTGFSSVTEFIIFVMRALASSGEIREEARLSTGDVRAINEGLRRLGYLE